jgi:hypothetical protein
MHVGVVVTFSISILEAPFLNMVSVTECNEGDLSCFFQSLRV